MCATKNRIDRSTEATSESAASSDGPRYGGEGVNLSFEFHGLTGEQRDQLLETHPILERSYTIPTLAIERTYEIVRDRVFARRSGVCFYGLPRVGKSTAAAFIEDQLIEDFPKAFVLRISARDSPRPNMADHMPRLLLEELGHAMSGRPKHYDVYQNAVIDIICGVVALGGTLFILIVDEFHLLSPYDLQQLLTVQNSLAMNKIKSVTISFGQPAILHRRTSMKIAEQTQLIARFLSEPIAFEGCSSVAELEVILRVYDEGSEYPDGSGLSYTAFFLPQAFSRGFRLTSYSKVIWKLLTSAAALLDGGVIPMEHLSMTIEHCLLAGYSNDAPNFILSESDIREAVQASNLALFGG